MLKHKSDVSHNMINDGINKWMSVYNQNREDEEELLDESVTDAERLNSIINKIKGIGHL